MTPRTVVRSLSYALLLFACECGGANGLPSALQAYGDGYEVTPTDQWTLAGYRFYRVSVVGVSDLSSTQMVALDADDHLVEGAALFALFDELPADALATHACLTLLDGCAPLANADPQAARWLDGDASTVRAPQLDDGRLVFDILEGDMAPQVVRITVDVAGGRVASREPLRDRIAASAPSSIHVTFGLSASPPRFVTATYEAGTPASISGCVSSVAGACIASTNVVLDDDAGTELTRMLADVRAIPRCEPDAIVPGDLDYTLSWPLAPRQFSGSVPSNESQMSARNAGPCRADARLAWWLARAVLAEGRAASDMPEPLMAMVTVSDTAFANLTVHFGASPVAIEGCITSANAGCHMTSRVELDEIESAALRARVEDLRAEPCHVPFPAGVPLSLTVQLDDDTRCPADPALGRWLAHTFMTRSPIGL